MVRRGLSISQRIFLAVFAIAVATIAAMTVMVAVSMRDGFSQYLAESELQRFDSLAEALIAAHRSDQPGWPELSGSSSAWNDFVRRNMGQQARLGPPPGIGRPIGAGGPPPAGLRPPPNDPLQLGVRLLLLDADGNFVAGGLEDGTTLANRPLQGQSATGQQTTVGYLALAATAGRPITADSVFLAGQVRGLVIAAALAIALSAAAAFLVSRYLVAPIALLVDGSRKLAVGDYAVQIASSRRDELGDLVDNFNRMAGALAEAEQAERQWLSDTSHELQTPISVMRAEIEALQDGVRQADERTLGELHDAVMRLARLVEDLKTLSYSREGGLVIHREPADIGEIAATVATARREAMERAGLTLNCDIETGVTIACDRMRIAQLIENLLENARRYTKAPGTVDLSLKRSGDRVEITVADSPPAPPTDLMASLFDRFVRAESSRSRALGGSGLGLPICRAIVEAHDGTIAAEPATQGGLQVTVLLPAGTS